MIPFKGKMFVFSAPSGSGKTTIVHHLLSVGHLNLDFSISATSRPARGKEIHEKDYYFMPLSAFEKHIKDDNFVEYEEVYKGAMYGTLKSEVDRIWKEGKHVVFDIDVIGGLKIKRQFPEDTLAVFVKPPSLKIMEQRLRDRKTDTEEKILERLAKAENEINYAKDFDFILINDDLSTAKKDAELLVENFQNKSDN
ncbi:MAG: guanylate kinase [Flavobacteriaceae bacterium]|nr:MAG: guanylate kinase [Flavobacteriaceae bacterium]